jgi:hypothetical protein
MNSGSESRRSAAASNELTVADDLFGALDGQEVTSEGDRWRIAIYGIHPGRRRYWIQVLLTGPEQYAATFRIDPDRPAELLSEVATALRAPDDADVVSLCDAA